MGISTSALRFLPRPKRTPSYAPSLMDPRRASPQHAPIAPLTLRWSPPRPTRAGQSQYREFAKRSPTLLQAEEPHHIHLAPSQATELRTPRGANLRSQYSGCQNTSHIPETSWPLSSVRHTDRFHGEASPRICSAMQATQAHAEAIYGSRLTYQLYPNQPRPPLHFYLRARGRDELAERHRGAAGWRVASGRRLASLVDVAWSCDSCSRGSPAYRRTTRTPEPFLIGCLAFVCAPRPGCSRLTFSRVAECLILRVYHPTSGLHRSAEIP